MVSHFVTYSCIRTYFEYLNIAIYYKILFETLSSTVNVKVCVRSKRNNIMFASFFR